MGSSIDCGMRFHCLFRRAVAQASASQARAYRQSRFNVLTDTPITLAVSQAAKLSVEHRQQFSRGLLLLGWIRWLELRHWGKNFKFFGPPSAPLADVL